MFEMLGILDNIILIFGSKNLSGLKNDCVVLVKTCARCNKNKLLKRKHRGRLGEYHAGCPMDRIHIYIMGPLTKTPNGNTCVFMVIDQFNKWIECYP